MIYASESYFLALPLTVRLGDVAVFENRPLALHYKNIDNPLLLLLVFFFDSFFFKNSQFSVDK